MIALNPNFITDDKGRKISAVLSMEEFKKILEELEDAEDVKLYDKVKAEDDGERISLKDYLKTRKKADA